MDIVLALLRTLIFVVATVAATVYVGRRIGRGHSLLWTGSTLMTLHWLISFGWTSYQAGSSNAPSDAAGWVVWSGSLLPFLAGLAFIWGFGQAAGSPSRGASAAGAPQARAGGPSPAEHGPAPADGGSASGTSVPAPSQQGVWQPSGGRPAPDAPGRAPRPAGTPTEQPHRHRPRPPGLVVPHAVPVVMTPASHHHSPPDPDPVVDLGPEEDAVPGIVDPPPGTPPIAPTGWVPTGPRPAPSPAAPAAGSSSPEGGSQAGPQTPS